MEEMEDDQQAMARSEGEAREQANASAIPDTVEDSHLLEEEQDGPSASTTTTNTAQVTSTVSENRIVLYDGPLLLLASSSAEDEAEESLKEQFLTPIIDMLVAGQLDPELSLENWSCRISRRPNGSVISCEYTTNEHETLRTMASIAKHFKVANLTRTQHKRDVHSSSQDAPRRLSTRVVPVREDVPATKKKRAVADSSDAEEDEDGEDEVTSKKNAKKKKQRASSPEQETATSSRARRSVRTTNNFAEVGGEDYESDEGTSAATAAAMANAQALADSVWGADKLGFFPSKNRQVLLNDHLKQMTQLVDELIHLDVAELFTSNAIKVPGGGPCNLREVRNKIRAMEYSTGGREATVYWDKLAEDVENIAKLFDSETVINSKTHVSLLLETLRTTCANSDAELQTALVKLRSTEEKSFLREKNMEPAMPRWRKELMPTYAYRHLDDYVPAEALLPEEKVQLMEKLNDVSSSAKSKNRWVYPDGLEMLDLWAQVIALDRSEGDAAGPNIADAIGSDKVVEQHTWGIDCFCRRNIQVSLAKLLSIQQTHYFTEQILLRAINAVRPIENGWNMRLALHNILAENAVQAEGEAEEEELPRAPTTLKYCRIKTFDAALDAWQYGRIIQVEDTSSRVRIALDDKNSTPVWLDLAQVRHQLIGEAHLDVYDRNLPRALLRACCELLLDHIEKKGERMFAVHSKGVGVVTKVPIETGKLIQKYTGILYPCWLWEQKEAQEDAERLERKRLTNQILLPDFWNMRLELPGGDSEGVDLLHVDAKHGGNFSSRMSHSCRPNCGTMTCVVDGKYCIGMRALRPIAVGEELTIDYNCVTDSNDEYMAAVCLCGSHDCRGSFLYTTNATKHVQVSNRSHLPIHRVAMLFAACLGEQPGELEKRYGKTATETWPIWISAEERAERRKKKRPGSKPPAFQRRRGGNGEGGGEDGQQMVIWPLITAAEEEAEREPNAYVDAVLKARGLGQRALQMLPNWLLRYAAYLVEYIDCEEFEFARLEYHKSENKATFMQDLDERWRISVLESNGAAEQRVTNLVIALDKARHHMRERLTPPQAADGGERSKLRDIWWVSDRCLSKWVGDDEDEFPEWYGATVTHVYVEKQELRLQYDTHEVNRVPMKLAKRPAVEEIPPPHTGCDVPHHQAPFRVLDEDDVLFFLWTDGDSGVATRLVKVLCEQLSAPIPLWQQATTVAGGAPQQRGIAAQKTVYWWNFDTREIRLSKPSPKQLELKTQFTPKILKQIQRLLLEKTPTTGEGARKCLRELRDLLLRIPIPPSVYAVQDNMHQKAADLLTLLANTKNFFVLREPEVVSTLSTATGKPAQQQQHAVINALTSWIGQGVENRVEDITEMIGSALLPSIERAYEHCAGDYRNQVRPVLLDHLRGNGLARWPKELRDAFPHGGQLPPQPADIETQWPHPLPPIRLFGSPSLDAAIYENFDYTRAVALAREANTRDLVRFAERDNKAVQHLHAVADALSKTAQRDWNKMDAEDRARVIAPVLPEEIHFTWVQCEHAECAKWRKLPFGFNERNLPTPFYCASLAPDIDEEHASCDVEQEQDYLPVANGTAAAASANLDALVRGDYLDVYDGKDWVLGLVLETNADALKLCLLQTGRTEWRSRLPSAAFSTLAQLHTYTTPRDLTSAMENNPYEFLYPEIPAPVSQVLHGAIRALERSVEQESKKKRSAGRARAKTRMTMARKMENLAKAQVSSAQMDQAQRNAFYSFFSHEKSENPLQPFITTVAKWNLLDPGQRMTWASTAMGKRGNAAAMASHHAAQIVPPPAPGEVFTGPGLLTSAKTPTQFRVTSVDDEHHNHGFEAEWCGGALVAGMLVETKYGRGVITGITSENSVCVALGWGHVFFAQDMIALTFPMFSACSEQTATTTGGGAGSRKRASGGGSRRKQVKLAPPPAAAAAAEEAPPKPLSAKKKKLLDPFAQMIEERTVRWRRRWAHMHTTV